MLEGCTSKGGKLNIKGIIRDLKKMGYVCTSAGVVIREGSRMRKYTFEMGASSVEVIGPYEKLGSAKPSIGPKIRKGRDDGSR